MKKKLLYIIFTAAALIVCLLPSVCMIFAKSDETIGNETEVKFPGELTENILEDMGDWFEHHYAFRPQLITADAEIQAGVFKLSNTDSVTVGSDGWLYYSSTVNDFTGKNTLSERGIWNAAHNIKLIQDYVESKGSSFLVTIPPNKNSLYGENMPYYSSAPYSDDRNRDHFAEAFEEAGVNYLDLYELFEGQGETLYLKEDSHWNNKGALMVYNAMLDSLEIDHEDFASAQVSRGRTHSGDLRAMIYPASDVKEWDFTYETLNPFEYISLEGSSDPVSVEDRQVESENPSGEGSLLMYRDSFGNTLIPFLSQNFESAYYSKATPYTLAADLSERKPDYVIIERVERSMREFASMPATIPASRAEIDKEDLKELENVPVDIGSYMYNSSYVAFTGTLEEESIDENVSVYLEITDARGETAVYNAYGITTAGSDYGFAVYLPVTSFGSAQAAQQAQVKVYADKQ